MSVNLNAFQAIPCVSYDTAGLSGSYQALNGSGFESSIKIMKIYNGSGVGIDISYDGINKHDFWPAGATLIIDFQTNHANSGHDPGTLNGKAGQVIYGKTSSTSTQLQIAGYR
jgi:hypothetical protein